VQKENVIRTFVGEPVGEPVSIEVAIVDERRVCVVTSSPCSASME
jgi:hypothetical protein